MYNNLKNIKQNTFVLQEGLCIGTVQSCKRRAVRREVS
jgi:hypothetical protein